MSFFKKLKDEFKEMMGDDKDKKDEVKTDAGCMLTFTSVQSVLIDYQ